MIRYIDIIADDPVVKANFFIHDKLTTMVANDLQLTKKSEKNIIEIKKSQIISEIKYRFFRSFGLSSEFTRRKKHFYNQRGYLIKATDFFDDFAKDFSLRKESYYFIGQEQQFQKILFSILNQFIDSSLLSHRQRSKRFGTKLVLQQDILAISGGGSQFLTGVFISEDDYNGVNDFIVDMSKLLFRTYDICIGNKKRANEIHRFNVVCLMASALTKLIYIAKKIEEQHQFVFKLKCSFQGMHYYHSEDFTDLVRISFNSLHADKDDSDMEITGKGIILKNPLLRIFRLNPRVPASFFIPTYKSVLCCLYTAIETFVSKERLHGNNKNETP